jgi:hypothetical protein
MRLFVGLAAALLSTGCFAYLPSPTPLPAPATQVRVRLSSTGTSELVNQLGPNVVQLDGRVMRVDPDSSITVAVSTTTSGAGMFLPYEGEGAVRLPRSAIASLNVRTLSRRRTTLFIGGMVLGAIGIAVKALDSGGGSPGDGKPPPPPPG